MSIIARQSTAMELSIGPVLDADGVAFTGAVVGDFKLKKTTGNFAALNASATLAHVSAGTYDLVLTTSDTDTVGLATIAIDDTVNACAPVVLQVIEEAVFDALYAASAAGYGTAQTGDSFARLGAPAGASVSVDLAAVKAETAAIVNDTDLIDDATSGLAKIATDVAAILVDTGTTLQGELDGIQASIGTPSDLGSGATVAANLADIESQTDDIGSAGDGLTGGAKIV
jgi:hypothetical protein